MELLTLLTQAKAAGFDIPNMACLVSIFLALKRMGKKDVQKLVDAIKGNEQMNNERFERIETHIGIKKELTKP